QGGTVSAGSRLCGMVVAATSLALVASGAVAGRAAQLGSSACKTNYSYAGVQNSGTRSGIRANLATVQKPDVKVGHVGGWVGVGGPGLGPNGTDEWMQSGYAAFQGGTAQIYYEVALPNKPPTYHTIAAKLSPSAKNLVSVLEIGNKHGSWRVWLNNKAVSPV